ncbi:MAG: SDR family oxidoreductase [Planctomycetota bacterium]
MRYRSIFRPDLFQGQVHLVTGGGTGIGRAIALELGSLGATVVLAARRPEPLEQVAEEVRSLGGRAEACPTNVREAEEVEALLAFVAERCGRLDGLVNNAGGQFLSPAQEISPNGWRSVVDLNLTGTFLVSRAAFKAFFADAGGAVVNVVSEMWRGFPGMAHSGAARAGVVNLTRTLAVEWAERGVRVNAVAPGVIASSGLETYPESARSFLDEIAADVPAKRFGSVSEVAAGVVYLLSPAASYVSGETLRIDGAASLWRKTWPIDAHDRWPTFDALSED